MINRFLRTFINFIKVNYYDKDNIKQKKYENIKIDYNIIHKNK